MADDYYYLPFESGGSSDPSLGTQQVAQQLAQTKTATTADEHPIKFEQASHSQPAPVTNDEAWAIWMTNEESAGPPVDYEHMLVLAGGTSEDPIDVDEYHAWCYAHNPTMATNPEIKTRANFEEILVPLQEQDKAAGEGKEEDMTGADLEVLTLEQWFTNIYHKEIMTDFHVRFPWFRSTDSDPQNLKWRDAQEYIGNHDPDTMELDHSVPEPPGIAFINKLISIDLDELNKEDRNYSVCHQPFITGPLGEIPLELPCTHIVGKQCLISCMLELGTGGDSCPICGVGHVEARKPISEYEGLEQRLGAVDYLLLRHGPLRLDREGRDRWQTVKDYVNEHLADRSINKVSDNMFQEKDESEPVLLTKVTMPHR